MIITEKWLKDQDACIDGREWVANNHPSTEATALIRILAEHRFDWTNWLIVRCLEKKQQVQYAIYAARCVLDIYEKKYPDDARPRKAIEAAVEYVKSENRDAAYAAGVAADAANDAAYAALYGATGAAAYASAYAAYAAARYYGAHAAAAHAASHAAFYTFGATDAAAKIEQSIINYGITLITL